MGRIYCGGGGLVAKQCLILATPRTEEPGMLYSPWDSLGKNTGVGCHFLILFSQNKKRKLWNAVRRLLEIMHVKYLKQCFHITIQ